MLRRGSAQPLTQSCTQTWDLKNCYWMDVEMKGWVAKDASGLPEILDKGMKIAQSFQVCCFPDFIVWQSVFAKRTPSISNVGCLYFSFYEPWAFGLPASYLCRLLSRHCLHVLPVSALFSFTFLKSLHLLRFQLSSPSSLPWLPTWCLPCSPASEALMDIRSGRCRRASATRMLQEAKPGGSGWSTKLWRDQPEAQALGSDLSSFT